MVVKIASAQTVLIKIVDVMDLKNAFVSQMTHLVVAASKKMNSKDWDPNLTPEQNYVLRQEGTETPGSSPFNNEKREGSYHCIGCGTKLFDSSSKYESGSGWPSFFKSIPGVFEEKKDMHIGYPRTEYHCKKCGGHHGHIFDDGPKPTGKRYCNNGVCLVFKPKS